MWCAEKKKRKKTEKNNVISDHFYRSNERSYQPLKNMNCLELLLRFINYLFNESRPLDEPHQFINEKRKPTIIHYPMNSGWHDITE